MLGTPSEVLSSLNASCLIYSGDTLIYSSPHSGVKPLLEFLEMYQNKDKAESLTLIDQITGKASYLLAVHIGISTIYTPLASLMALDSSKSHNTALHYEVAVPFILNREKTDLCPLEASVLHTEDPYEALLNITSTVQKMINNENVTLPLTQGPVYGKREFQH